MGYFDPVPANQGFQPVRQIFLLRHDCAVDQNRNDANIARERGFDLDANEITRIVETPSIVLVAYRKPVLANDGDESIAISDTLGQDLYEIEPGFDIVDVVKDTFAFQPVDQAVINPTDESGRILAPVADENPARQANAPSQRKLPCARWECKPVSFPPPPAEY